MNREIRLIVNEDMVDGLLKAVEVQKNISRTFGNFETADNFEHVQRQLQYEKERQFS